MSGRTRIAAFAALLLIVFTAGYLIRGGGGGTGGPVEGDRSASQEQAAAEVWTCSMHPQIRLPEPGKCPICFMDLIPASSGSADEAGERRLAMSEAAVKLAEIRTVPVERRHTEAVLRAVGSVDFDETRVADIAAWVPGRIEKLMVNFTGAEVRRGDPLAEVYSPGLVSAQEELLQAARFDAAAKGEDPSSPSSTLNAAREKLRQYGLTDIQIAEIESGGEVRRRVVTYAPSSGVVVELAAREGQYVKTGTVLMRIADLSKVWVTLRVFQSDLPLVGPGQEVTFTSTALPGETFSGEVVFVDPVLDPRTMTAGVRAVASNYEGRLRPEMFVRGEIYVQLGADGRAASRGDAGHAGHPLVIPATAPLLTGRRAVVYVRLPGAEPVFEGRDVTLGPRAGGDFVVLSGLEEGELVVANGAFKIDSELQIRAKVSMMNPEGGAAAPVHDHGSRGETSGGSHGGVSHADGTHGGVSHAGGSQGGEGAREKAAAGGEALKALEPVYRAYFDVQMALAGDDLAGAVEAYGELAEKVRAVDMSLFEGPAHEIWMGLSAEIAKYASQGARSGDIAGARDAFYYLSKPVIELQESIGHSGGDFFLTFCPMARDNAGAFWIQEVDTVYNSFYGAAMLRCGSIEKKLPPARGE